MKRRYQMKKSNEKTGMIIAVLEAVVSLFMILAVKIIAPVCPGMLELVSGKQVHMKCYYAGVVFVFFAVLLLISAALCFVTKQQLTCGIMTISLAVFVFLTFHDSIGVGICANPDMACQMTAPFVKVSATIELILGAVSVFLAIQKGAEEK